MELLLLKAAMDQPIVFTPREFTSTIIAICAAIVTISAAITVIFNVVKKAREPEDVQNQRITNVEEGIKLLNTRVDTLNGYVDQDKKRLDHLEFGNEATNEALLALLNHALNGNDVDGLKSAKKKLEAYLISRRE